MLVTQVRHFLMVIRKKHKMKNQNSRPALYLFDPPKESPLATQQRLAAMPQCLDPFASNRHQVPHTGGHSQHITRKHCPSQSTGPVFASRVLKRARKCAARRMKYWRWRHCSFEFMCWRGKGLLEKPREATFDLNNKSCLILFYLKHW